MAGAELSWFEKNTFEESWLNNVHINDECINNNVKVYEESVPLVKECEIDWLLKAITFIDLTSLNANDTPSSITKLCFKAVNPIQKILPLLCTYNEGLKEFLNDIKTAAVCVYPLRVLDAVDALKELQVALPVASVAAGFPSGLFPLDTRLSEIAYCVENGAQEIDIVIDRSLVVRHKWEQLYDEIKQMKKACRTAHMKTILAVGECGSLENIYKASMVAMMAGSDFIKTSTGKEAINATLPFGTVMCRAIKDFYNKTGIKIGLKPAGGLKTYNDALNWMKLVKSELGAEWLTPHLFRIGASSLLQNIEDRLHFLASDST